VLGQFSQKPNSFSIKMHMALQPRHLSPENHNMLLFIFPLTLSTSSMQSFLMSALSRPTLPMIRLYGYSLRSPTYEAMFDAGMSSEF